MTIRRIAMQAATANLTAGKTITVDANGLLIDGSLTSPVAIVNGGTGSGTAAAARLALGLVDANDRMPTAMLPTTIMNSYWHASNDEKTVVSGTWATTADASQTDRDSAIINAAGYLANLASGANNDECHFGNLALNAGTYLIKISTVRSTNWGILELLHGTTSLGTSDRYGAVAYNQVVTFTYSPTTFVTGNLRLKVSGKHASSTGYNMGIGRLEIIRTG